MNSEEVKDSSFVSELVLKLKKLSDSCISKGGSGLAGDLTGVNVLLVEDNPISQLVATDLLTEVNAVVEVGDKVAEG